MLPRNLHGQGQVALPVGSLLGDDGEEVILVQIALGSLGVDGQGSGDALPLGNGLVVVFL